MGNSASRVVGCFRTQTKDDGEGPAIALSGALDEGLGHSFCYIRPALDSPSVSPPHSHPLVELVEKLGVESDQSEHVSHDYQLDEPMGKSRVGLDRLAGDKSKGFLDRPRSSFEKLKPISETSFKSISGASVSANTATPRSILCNEQFATFSSIPFDRAADFKSTSSFTALPLQPVPRGVPWSGPVSGPLSSGPLSGPLDRGFLSGPLERGFMSGPLERGFLSGPLERGYLSGPLEPMDRSHFSAPLGGRYSGYLRRRRHSLSKFVKAVSRPFIKVIAKTSARLVRSQRGSHVEDKQLRDVQESPPDTGYTSSELETKGNDNLQWAQGKAGEDRVHVVLSEEHGWLFVGIYDGFNGPDAPDFLMSNLYPAIYRELKGLLWDQDGFEPRCARAEEDLEARGCCAPGETPECCQDVSCTSESNLQHRGVASMNDDLTEGKDAFAHDSVVVEGGKLGAVVVEDDNTTTGAYVNVSGCVKKNRMLLTSTIAQGDYELYGRCRQQAEQPLQYQSAPERGDKGLIPEPLGGKIFGQKCKKLHGGRESGFHASKAVSQYLSQLSVDSTSRDRPEGRKENSKYLQWRYDWEQEKPDGDEKSVSGSKEYELVQSLSWSKGAADHGAVLGALARALAATEDAYLDMADQALDENPELALMGSCVLVMLMKDEDVYIMNVGDSRAILAQHPKVNDVDSSLKHNRVQTVAMSNSYKVDDHDRVGARDSMLRLELERIIEETPTELAALEAYDKGNMGLPAAGQLLGALQLSTDHSTSIYEEVSRIRAEHPDDDLSICNDRVKGSLKVTRAFGAGFLKQPKWNSALLEMFRIDFIGTTPYITCTPFLNHHRLGPDDHFLVLSSDGLYQYMSNEEVISHVEWFMEKFPDGDPAQHLIEEVLFRAAKNAGMDFHELLDIPQGDRRKYHDDVSVMVISLEGRIWRSSG